MSTPRSFTIYTDDRQSYSVEAPSLRAALRAFNEKERKVRVIAAIDQACQPPPSDERHPFVAVLLRNPNFTPPKEV